MSEVANTAAATADLSTEGLRPRDTGMLQSMWTGLAWIGGLAFGLGGMLLILLSANLGGQIWIPGLVLVLLSPFAALGPATMAASLRKGDQIEALLFQLAAR